MTTSKIESNQKFTKKEFDHLIDSIAKNTKLVKHFAEMDSQLQDELIESMEGGFTALINALKRCSKSNLEKLS